MTEIEIETPPVPLTTKDKLIFLGGAALLVGPCVYLLARSHWRHWQRQKEGRSR
jgi:hypothetical protein